MNIMTLNCGSSSVKYALFDMPDRIELCHETVEGVATGGSFSENHELNSQKHSHYHERLTHDTAIGLILDFLTDRKTGVLKSISEISAVGHRVVHGGKKFTRSVIIDDKVIKEIKNCSVLAPLHNPANLAGIRAVMKLMPDVTQVATFDTAFFTTMLPYVFMYGMPYEWYKEYHIRKYGFHGTSHRYVAGRAAILLGREPYEVSLITLHIGNGVSITAVKGGVAYDHSMGFTPLEGAVMGTRCGDIDPGILLYVMRQEKLSYRDMEDILNKRSGLFGISGKYVDRREILKAMEAGDERAKLSFEVECYRLRKYIGAYMAAMGEVDAIVFSAGVGENSFLHRQQVCEGLESLGIRLDDKKNKQAVGGQIETEISSPLSRIRVFVIPTNEELMIAEDTYALLQNKG